MKSTILLFVFLTSLFHSFSQDEDDYISFVTYWSIGDSYDFSVTKVKKQWAGGELTKNDSSQYIVNFEVIDSTESSYKVKWSHKLEVFDSFDFTAEEIEFFGQYEDIDVIFTTTEMGEFVEIENWEQIKDMMSKVMADLIAFEQKNMTDEEIALYADAMKPFESMYSTKEGIEQLVYGELQYFHYPFGVMFDINETIEYEDALPNFLGGEPIRGDGKIYFESVDYDEESCVFYQELSLNPKDTKELLTNLFSQMGIDSKELSKMLKSTKFTINDINRYEYYYYPGIPIKIDVRRNSEVKILNEHVVGLDQTIIELIVE